MAAFPTELVDVAINSAPWPLVRADGSLEGGPGRWLPNRCAKCPGRPCRRHDEVEVTAGVCIHNLAILQLSVAGQALCIPGAITKTRWSSLPRKRKKATAGRVVSVDVTTWRRRVDQLSSEFSAAVDEGVDEALGMFHDVLTTLSALIRNTEEWVSKQPGAGRDEQLEALSPIELTIVKTVELLQTRIALMPLVVNPAAASFGKMRRTPIYRACDRLIRILSPEAARRGIRLELQGSSFNEPDCYNSFDTIPLVLLDNAMKYSLSGQPIDITINDGPGGGQVTLEVTSISPTIAGADRVRMFDKGYRGHVAAKVASGGSGLGLYLAQTVAKAHGATIQHRANEGTFGKDGTEYSENTFRVIFS